MPDKNLSYAAARDNLDRLLIEGRRAGDNVSIDLQDRIIKARVEVRCAQAREKGIEQGTELRDVFDPTTPHRYVFVGWIEFENRVHYHLLGGAFGPVNGSAQRSDFEYRINGEWLDLYRADREA
jgi:hypothetical protein